ncbi:hypothetical protein ACJ73_09708, partial [Blastomyces percursus]
TQPTTLPEFLDACHVHLFLGLAVQTNSALWTTGSPENADRKLRPTKICEWTSFPAEQALIWKDLMASDFHSQRQFTHLMVLEENGREVSRRMIGSEMDLNIFQRQTIEMRVTSIIEKVYANPPLRRVFKLKGDISFENHANTLTDESNIAAEMNLLSIDQEQPRRSARLAALPSRVETQAPTPTQTPAQAPISRARADQFCVYNKGGGLKVPAFIIEYKAPHKVSKAHIKAGLQDMDLDKVLHTQKKKKKSPEEICRRVMAAIITQAFSYMIQCGVEFGSVCTGEVYIYLRVLHDDPGTVYYFLSIPDEDVGQTTGWTGDLHSDNRLHLTAVGQMTAFTLRALQTPVRSISWISSATERLPIWEMIYADVLTEIKKEDIPSSEFKPSTRSREEYCRASPIKTRSKDATVSICNPSKDLGPVSDDDSGDDFDPNTPSRPPTKPRPLHPSLMSQTSRSKGKQQASQSKGKQQASQSKGKQQASQSKGKQQASQSKDKSQTSQSKDKPRGYCTQKCLLGMVKGWKLDRKCPNVSQHGTDKHRLNRVTLMRLLNDQLSGRILGPGTDLGCDSLHVHGSRGAMFKITLWSHGYTFVGKGLPMAFVNSVRNEELVYSRLSPIQGRFVPVFLGNLLLRRRFSYDGIAEIAYLLCMGFAGRNLIYPHGLDRDHLVQQAKISLQAIHGLGVLHNDPSPRNITWNEEDDRVMLIDFERSILLNKRMPLGVTSPNQKSKPGVRPMEKMDYYSQLNSPEEETGSMVSDMKSVWQQFQQFPLDRYQE